MLSRSLLLTLLLSLVLVLIIIQEVEASSSARPIVKVSEKPTTTLEGVENGIYTTASQTICCFNDNLKFPNNNMYCLFRNTSRTDAHLMKMRYSAAVGGGNIPTTLLQLDLNITSSAVTNSVFCTSDFYGTGYLAPASSSQVVVVDLINMTVRKTINITKHLSSYPAVAEALGKQRFACLRSDGYSVFACVASASSTTSFTFHKLNRTSLRPLDFLEVNTFVSQHLCAVDDVYFYYFYGKSGVYLIRHKVKEGEKMVFKLAFSTANRISNKQPERAAIMGATARNGFGSGVIFCGAIRNIKGCGSNAGGCARLISSAHNSTVPIDTLVRPVAGCTRFSVDYPGRSSERVWCQASGAYCYMKSQEFYALHAATTDPALNVHGWSGLGGHRIRIGDCAVLNDVCFFLFAVTGGENAATTVTLWISVVHTSTMPVSVSATQETFSHSASFNATLSAEATPSEPESLSVSESESELTDSRTVPTNPITISNSTSETLTESEPSETFSGSLELTPSNSSSSSSSHTESGTASLFSPSESLSETRIDLCNENLGIELRLYYNPNSGRSLAQEQNSRTVIARGKIQVQLRLRERNEDDWFGPMMPLSSRVRETGFSLFDSPVGKIWTSPNSVGVFNVTKVRRMKKTVLLVDVDPIVTFESSLSDIAFSLKIHPTALSCHLTSVNTSRLHSNELMFPRRYAFMDKAFAEGVNFASTASVFSNMFLGGGAAGRKGTRMTQSTRLALKSLECEAGEDEPFDTLEAPISVPIGAQAGGYARSAVICNILMTLAASLITGLACWLWSVCKKKEWYHAQGKFALPASLLNVYGSLVGGVLGGALVLLRLEEGSKTDKMLAAAGFIFSIVPVAFLAYRVLPPSRFWEWCDAKTRKTELRKARSIDPVSFRMFRVALSFCQEKCEWTPPDSVKKPKQDQKKYYFVKRYGSLFDKCVGRMYLFDLILQILAILQAAMAIIASESRACSIVRIFQPACVAITFAMTCQMPFARAIDNLFMMIESLLNLMATVFVLLSIYFEAEELYEQSEKIEMALKMVTVIAFAVDIFWIIYGLDVVQRFLESVTKKPERNQKRAKPRKNNNKTNNYSSNNILGENILDENKNTASSTTFSPVLDFSSAM